MRILTISDTHIGDQNNLGDLPNAAKIAHLRLNQVLNELNKFDYDFVVHCGDICSTGPELPTPNLYDEISAILGSIKKPILFISGNHDDPVQVENLQNKHKGNLQINKFQNLDQGNNSYYVNLSENICGIFIDSRLDIRPIGEIKEKTIDSIIDFISKLDNQRVFIFTHYPPVQTGIPWVDGMMLVRNGDALVSKLAKYSDKILGLTFGHVHGLISVFGYPFPIFSAPSTFLEFNLTSDAHEPSVLLNGTIGAQILTISEQSVLVTNKVFGGNI